MINIKDKAECCGCSACMAICSKKAISMQADTPLGFLYPHVDISLCINCGRCEEICQFKKNYKRYENYDSPIVYALRTSNKEEFKKSQSGAAFLLFSDLILLQGGVIYGAIFDKGFQVIHSRARSKEEREKMRMSKYVQSDMRNIYISIKNDLKLGLKVLFTGTPCQVAGIRSFIGEKLSTNLYTIDLVCHGVPSPKVWQDYLNFLRKKYKQDIFYIITRDKKYGWSSHNETYILANGKEKKRSTFRELFYRHYIVRESCSNCKFTNIQRVSDITIGDFWGWEKYHTEFMDNKGLSLVYINSNKGQLLFDSITPNAEIVKSSVQESIQPQLLHPITLPTDRDIFLNSYQKFGFKYIAYKYSDIGLYYKFHSFIFNLLAKLKK